jgi:hypothetical protein
MGGFNGIVEYLRKESESDFDYIIRLIEGKSNGIYDIDYIELFKLGFNVDISSEEARKRYYGLKMLLPYLDIEKFKNITSNKIINELELKKLEIQKEKEKNRTIKIELNKMLRQDARFEMFCDEIRNSIESIESPIFNEYICDNGVKVGVLGISDIHFSKIFNSVNNSYSIEICYERMNILLSEVIDWIKDRNISYLHIVNAGDNIEGLIRVNQIRVLETGVIDSVIEFSKMMAEWLNQLSKYISITYHHVISANHSEVRFLNQKAGSFPDEDLEKIIIHMIAGILKDNQRIEVPIYKKDYVFFNIGNKNIFATHGHQYRNKKVADIIKELQMLHGITIDILLMGHLHHEENITVGENANGNIKVILLPAIMGSDNFSDSLFTGAKSGATLIEFNSEKKGITTTEVILN